MKNDILLIYPPLPGLNHPLDYPPLQLLYLAANCEKNGIKVMVENLAAHKHVDVTALPHTPYVGIYVSQSTLRGVEEIIQEFQRLRKDTKIILGGPQACAHAQRLYDMYGVNWVCEGEGEYALVEILQGRHPEGVVRTSRITDLDALPFPARHLLPNEYVFNTSGRHRMDDTATTTLLTSRGCPYRCAFCSKIEIMQGYPIRRSSENVMEELEICRRMSRHPVSFRIIDDAFNLDKKRLIKWCELLIGKGFTFLCGVRGDTIQDLDMLKLMKNAGWSTLCIGVEAADDRMNTVHSKDESMEIIKNGFRLAREAGLKTHAMMIFGLPGETLESIENKKKFMREVKPDTWIMSTFTPLPGSPIWEHPEKYGITIDIEKYSGWYYHEPDEDNDIPDFLPDEVKAARGPLIQYLRSGEWRQ